MKRKLFTLAAALSLVFAVAVAWFWGSGHLLGWKGVWERTSSDGLTKWTYAIEISGGGTALSGDRIVESQPGFSADERSWKRTSGDEYPQPPTSALTFGSQWAVWSVAYPLGHGRLTSWEIIVPCWALFALSAGLAMALCWKRGRVACPNGTVCLQCGYDLRASPDRCPECATAVPKKTEAKT